MLMLKFNLLEEIQSIRNTVTEDTPVPGQGGARGTKTFWGVASLTAAAAIFAVAVVVGDVTYEPGRSPPIVIDFTNAKRPESSGDFHSSLPEPVSDEQPASLAMSSDPAPDEIDRKDDPAVLAEPTPSRPIADKASGAIKSKLYSKEVWYIRFALCVMEKSCNDILAGLKRKGVNAYMIKSKASVMIHRAIVGSWPTGAHAQGAKEKLQQAGFQSSLFSSGARFYLSTAPFTAPNQAEAACRRIESMDFSCERSSKKEIRKVYKVYEKAYKNKRQAVMRREIYSRRGIECIVERSG
jgi:cell division septation protein DedD